MKRYLPADPVAAPTTAAPTINIKALPGASAPATSPVNRMLKAAPVASAAV